MILHVKSDAGIDRARIDVNGDRALGVGAEVVESMNCLELIRSHHRAAGRGLDLADHFELRALRPRDAIDPDHVLVFGVVTPEPFVIDDGQIAALRDHPAELAVVSVNGGLLTRLPADGHHFKKVVAVYQIARVKRVVEKNVGGERRICDPHARTEFQNAVSRDQASLERAEPVNEVVDAYQMR